MAKGKSKKTKVVTGLDIGDLSKARPTRIPQVTGEIALEKDNPLPLKMVLIHVGILLAIVMIAYVNSLFGQFVFNDHHIEEYLRSWNLEQNLITQTCLHCVVTPLNRPWLLASLALDLRCPSFQATWCHFVNVVLHAASCLYFYCLLFCFLRQIAKREGKGPPPYEIALIASAILACHPLGAESVSYVAGRVGTLVACNYFLALTLFMVGMLAKSSQGMLLSYCLAIVFLLMGVWSGPEALTIPACALVLLYLLRPNSTGAISTGKNWLRSKWPEIAVLTLLTMAAVLLSFRGIGTELSNSFGAPAPTKEVYFASQFRALIVYYLPHFLAPAGLSVLPPYVLSSGWRDPIAWLGLIVLITTIWLIYKFQSKPLTAFGLCLCIFAFAPAAFTVQSELAADHRFYVPVAGLAVVLSGCLVQYVRLRARLKIAALALLFITLSSLTIWRNTAWHSDLDLWLSTLATNPHDACAQAMLAGAWLNAGKDELASKQVSTALHLDPDNVIALMTQGQIQLKGKLYMQALGSFSKALDIARKNRFSAQVIKETQIGLAMASLNIGQYAKARDLAMFLLAQDQKNSQINLIIGKSLIGLKQSRLALSFLNNGYSVDKANVEYLEPIAQACLESDTPELVRSAYGAARAALRVVPNDNVKRIFVRAALETGRLEEADRLVDLLLAEHPNDAQLLYLKACVQKELGQTQAAKKYRVRALNTDPQVAEELKVKILEPNERRSAPLRESAQ